MIDVTQLMIGSWVEKPDGTQIQLTEVNRSGVVKAYTQIEGFEYWTWDQMNPVKLSTDWLKRAGFENTDYQIEKWPVQLMELKNNNGYAFQIYLTRESEHGRRFEIIVRYVHELQLLMAGLGRPLTFNDKTS